MRKFILSAACIISCIGFAQTEERGIVYYMPKTEVEIELQYTYTIHQPGMYATHAKELLGVDANTFQDTMIHMDKVELHTRTQADRCRYYVIPASASRTVQMISLNKKGILEGYNLSDRMSNDTKDKNNITHPKKETPKPVELALPFNEETIKASETDKPQAIAKQIYQLREIRTYTLSGDVEHAPADGKAMKAVLDELDKQEKALTELFIGKDIQETKTITLRMLPKDSMDSVVVEIANQPVRVVMMGHHPEFKGNETQSSDHKKSKADTYAPIYYNLPGWADIRVLIGDTLMLAKRIDVAQMGISLSVSQELLEDDKTQILFNTQTGNIQRIEKKQ